MFSRRSFFRRAAAIVAAVALAPEIAFRQRLSLPAAPAESAMTVSFWTQTSSYTHCVSQEYLRWRNDVLAAQ